MTPMALSRTLGIQLVILFVLHIFALGQSAESQRGKWAVDQYSARSTAVSESSSQRACKGYLGRQQGEENDPSRIASRNVGQGLNFYSRAAEKALGSKLASVIESQAEILDDPVVTEYINRIEQRIVCNSDLNESFTVKVVKDIEANAYSLPGGHVYIQCGLILSVATEGELAAALAHETAHITARHFTRLGTKQQMWRWLSIIAGGPVGFLFERKALPLLLSKSLRNYEFEADILGVEYQYASGYDPKLFVELLKKLDEPEQERDSLRERLSGLHPFTKSRLSRLEKYIARNLSPQPVQTADPDELTAIQDRIESLIDMQRLTSIVGPRDPLTPES
jgi:predicted Zn-dependent protease